MNTRQINAAKLIYNKNFASEMSPEAIAAAEKITKLDDLDDHEDILSAGEYDCIEYVLLPRR